MLTQTMGPWLKYPDSLKDSTILSFEKKIMTNLIDQLPENIFFVQNFNYSITNWLPFFWKGFKQTTRYTYVIEDISDPDKVFNSFKSEVRFQIRKAQKLVQVYSDDNLKEFFKIHCKTFKRQHLDSPYNLEVLKKIDKICKSRNCREILFAKDEQERIHCAIFLVWDANSIYYLMGGQDSELRSSGAQSLLIWEAIKRYHTIAKCFDFEGSMVESIETFFRKFNPVQKPYFQIYKQGSRLKSIKHAVKSILNRSY